jgi:hypothetical protein
VKKRLFISDDFFKGIRTVGGGGNAPYFSGAKGRDKGEFAGVHTGSVGAPMPNVGAPASGGKSSPKGQYGPKGGHIKEISASTGKPVYYKKWASGASNKVALAQGTSGGTPQGYHEYKSHPEHVIGTTSRGNDIHAHSGVNNTKHYKWDDHRDASQAHFALSHHLMNVLRERAASGGDTSKLQGLITAHANFARHHREESLKDLLHGKQRSASKEDLSKREGPKSR